MSAQRNSTPKLIRALKPGGSVTAEAVHQASMEAQERWPLLKSVRPEKWQLAPKLADTEKHNRSAVDAPVSAPKVPPRASSSLDLRLAQGLLRMAATVAPVAEVVAPKLEAGGAPPELVSTDNRLASVELFKKVSVVEVPETVQVQSPVVETESIQAVLSRVLQANERTAQSLSARDLKSPKQPGFLSRLGKR
jgi:hypothetical protein